MNRKLIRYIINHYIDTRKLLSSLRISVKSNNSMFCPMHQNTRTPSAHLYHEEDGSYCIYCYSEQKSFTNMDLYEVFLPDINLEELAKLLYSKLSDEEKNKIEQNVNQEFILPELPYKESLQLFKDNKINYDNLLLDINKSQSLNSLELLLEKIYDNSESYSDVLKTPNKYLYYMKNNKTQYRYLNATKILLALGNELPAYFREYLGYAGDSIVIPNIINKYFYSLTFRNINGEKRFLKLGNTSQLLYNLGNLPSDFKYGTPLLIVEGNLDCDVAKEIYPYTVATLTNSISQTQLQLIKGLTNKVILAYDNDEAGNTGYNKNAFKLAAQGIMVKRFEYSNGIHDFGDLLELKQRDIFEYNYLVQLYKVRIASMF